MPNYNLNVAPRLYQFQNKAIPAGLTLTEGFRYLIGCGAGAPAASTLALHNRASTLAARLASLVEQSGNPDLTRKAEHEIQKWNHESEELFNQR